MKPTSQMASEYTVDSVYHKQPVFEIYHSASKHMASETDCNTQPGYSTDVLNMIVTEVKWALEENP